MLRTHSEYVLYVTAMLAIRSTDVIHSFSIWKFIGIPPSDVPQLMRNAPYLKPYAGIMSNVHITYV